MTQAEIIPLDTAVAINAAVIDAARRAMSENSWRALRADIRIFGAWCASLGVGCPETVDAHGERRLTSVHS